MLNLTTLYFIVITQKNRTVENREREREGGGEREREREREREKEKETRFNHPDSHHQTYEYVICH